LNDPYFFDAARAMAQRLMTEGGTGVADRIRYGFRVTTSRMPSESELARVSAFYQKQDEEYSRSPELAYKVLGRKVDNAAETAAWTMVANVLLNSDEAITKE
jgi:hypothetical protein